MNRAITTIITLALVLAAAAAHAQIVALGEYRLLALSDTRVRVGDTIEMVWSVTSAAHGVRWEQRIGVSGCAASGGTIYYGSKDAGHWNFYDAGALAQIARATCHAFKERS